MANGVANAQIMEGPGTAEGLGEDGVCSGAAAMEISEVCYLK
jgi:hypothetical protein